MTSSERTYFSPSIICIEFPLKASLNSPGLLKDQVNPLNKSVK
jgi:hypothetical protein